MSDELQPITDFFDLGKILEVEQAAGQANRNFFVTTLSGKYLVKIIEERNDVNEVTSEIPYLERLYDKIAVIPYLSNPEGQVVFHEGNTIALVQQYIEHSPVRRDEEALLQLVREQARLHMIDYTDLPQRNHWLDLEYITRTLDQIERHGWMINTDLLRNHPAAIQDWSGCALSIVHGDMHLGNALFDEKIELLAIIDWEEVGVGYAILDFALMAAAFRSSDPAIDKGVLEKMITVYEEIRAFSDQEKQLMDMAIDRAHITEFVWKCRRKHQLGDTGIWDARDCKCFASPHLES